MDVGCRALMVCHDLSVPHGLCKFNHVYVLTNFVYLMLCGEFTKGSRKNSKWGMRCCQDVTETREHAHTGCTAFTGFMQ